MLLLLIILLILLRLLLLMLRGGAVEPTAAGDAYVRETVKPTAANEADGDGLYCRAWRDLRHHGLHGPPLPLPSPFPRDLTRVARAGVPPVLPSLAPSFWIRARASPSSQT